MRIFCFRLLFQARHMRSWSTAYIGYMSTKSRSATQPREKKTFFQGRLDTFTMHRTTPNKTRRLLTTAIALWPLALAQYSVALSGDKIYREVTKTTPIYQDEKLSAYIRQLGNQVVAQSEMAGENFTFTLLDSPDLNAFATQGNYVYINRGLLNYVSNEAQLVSVLAHEVAHITHNHIGELRTSAVGTQILSTIAAVLSGSGEVYEAGMAYGESLVRGRGRTNELEADEVGAEYMAKLGYDPDEMLQMLSIMKDYESLMKQRAIAQGSGKQTYHGIFSTHPRNDSRLRTVVTKARKLQPETSRDNGAATYREHTQGLVWGENFAAKSQPPERFFNRQLRLRLDFPEGWEQTVNGINYLVRGQAADERASLTLQSLSRTLQTPEEYLYNQLKLPQLRNGTAISPAGLQGYSGILPGSGDSPDQRIALIYYKMNAYLLTGAVERPADFAEIDKLFVKSIQTFRPISNREIAGQNPKRIHYIQADSTTTFAKLAKTLKLSAADSDNLRLINGFYPSGEPQAGQWIKIFKH